VKHLSNARGPIQTFMDALWWSVATITTVGYGDVYPITPGGRSVAVFLMLTGISLFGVLAARIAAFFVEEEQRETQDPRLDAIVERLDRIEQQLARQQQRRSSTRRPRPPSPRQHRLTRRM
jgi:voltage-gated potassium channel